MRLLKLILCFILINALAIAATRVIGSQIRTPESRLFETGNCSQPCWHGIQPGKTTLDEAEAILYSESDFVTGIVQQPPLLDCDIEWSFIAFPEFWGCASAKNGIISDMWVGVETIHFKTAGLDLGYALYSLGSPIAAEVCGDSNGASYASMYTNQVKIYLELDWVYDGIPFPKGNRDLAWVDVKRIHYSDKPIKAPHAIPWHGFTIRKKRVNNNDLSFDYFVPSCSS